MSITIPLPDTAEVQLWRARMPAAFGPVAGRLWLRRLGWLAFWCWFLAALWSFGATPLRLWHGVAGLAVILGQMIPPEPGPMFGEILRGLGESLAMAFLGTLAASLVALPLGFLGAGNVVRAVWLRFPFRRFLDAMRGIDQLVWALTFVRAVGLGPLAGMLAIFAADLFVMTKLNAEAIEAAEKRQQEAVAASGAGRLAVLRFGLLPQVLPVLISHALYFFESNTRAAAILGVVGAGGIGLQISQRIQVREWGQVAFIIILLMVMVAVIDALSARIRRFLVS